MGTKDIKLFCFGRRMTNIGDQVQEVGYLNAMKLCGMDTDSVPRIYGYENRDDSEMSYIAYGYYDYHYGLDLFPVKENESPIFLSLHCTDEKRVNDFKGIADRIPFIGCRDYASYMFFKNNMSSVPVFMSGCFSLIQEKRKEIPANPKTYLVDISDGLREHIPEELLNNAVEATHDDFHFCDDNDTADKEASLYVRRWLNELKENAGLVITSRLHCALPCVAMGIPVIVARNYRDNTDRYTGFEKLFHVYLPYEYEKINWNPVATDIEAIKAKMVDNVGILWKAMEEGRVYDPAFIKEYCSEWEKINDFFMPDRYTPYYVGEFSGYLSQERKIDFFNNHFGESIIKYITGKPVEECSLVIYGAGDRGKYFINRYEEEINRFKSVCYVDGNPQKQNTYYMGIMIYSPNFLEPHREDLVIIVGVDRYYERAGREIATYLANNLGYAEGRDFLMLDKLDNSSRLAMTKASLNAPLL